MSESWGKNHLFYRQVNQNHWDGERPNSQAFLPYPKDEDKLSVDDSGLVSAEEAWRHFTQSLGYASVGTWAVSFDEVEEAGNLSIARSPVIDESSPERNNPAHCHIDFGNLDSKGKKRKRAQMLAIRASERGCLFKPE